MTRGKVTLSPFHKRSFYLALGLLWASGAVWLFFYYVGLHKEVTSSFPLQVWTLKIHGALAMIFMIILGSLLPVHIRLAWNQNRNRLAGAWLIGLNAFLIITGWMLYYVGNETTRTWISLLHWSTGLGLPLFVYMHIRFARHYPEKRRPQYHS